ncbi:MAG: ankyrin repeat domain-containing protein [Granulosicoccus sp.]
MQFTVFVLTGVGANAAESIAKPSSLNHELRADWSKAIVGDKVPALALLWETESSAALLSVKAGNGKTALMAACKKGDQEFAMQLVKAGADINALTSTNGTALMFAVLGNRLSVAMWLQSAGADINQQGSNGWSAMIIAAALGLDEMVDWLLSVDADANAVDVYRFTPLMRAVDNGHLGAARLLLNAPGVNPDAQNEVGNTALHHAIGNNDIALVTVLLEYQADSLLANREGLTPMHLAAESDGVLSVLQRFQSVD